MHKTKFVLLAFIITLIRQIFCAEYELVHKVHIKHEVNEMAFSQDGSRIILGSHFYHSPISIWSSDTGENLYTSNYHENFNEFISAQNPQEIFYSTRSSIQKMNLRNPKSTKYLEFDEANIMTCSAITPDEKYSIFGDYRGALYARKITGDGLYDWSKAITLVPEEDGFEAEYCSHQIAVTPQYTHVLALYARRGYRVHRRLKIWKISPSTLDQSNDVLQNVPRFEMAGNAVNETQSIEITTDGRFMAATCLEKIVVFKIKEAIFPIHHFPLAFGLTTCSKLLPDSKSIVIGTHIGHIDIRDLETGNILATLPTPNRVDSVKKITCDVTGDSIAAISYQRNEAPRYSLCLWQQKQ